MSNKMQIKNTHNAINIDRIKNLEISLKRSKEDLDRLDIRRTSDEFLYLPGWVGVKSIISQSYKARLKELKKTQKNLTIC